MTGTTSEYAGKSWTESIEIPLVPEIQIGAKLLVASTISLFVPGQPFAKDVNIESIVEVYGPETKPVKA